MIPLHPATPPSPDGKAVALDRPRLMDWYARNRARSRQLFDLLSPEAYFTRPIALRHPVVFYDGHLPAFSFNTLVKRGLGGDSIDPQLEQLFARGIDPHESQADGTAAAAQAWPSRATVQQFAREVDRRVLDALARGDIEQPGHPLLQRAEAAYCILEHEAMHHETLLYMWHQLPLEAKRRPDGYHPVVDGPVPEQAWILVPEGDVTLGAEVGDEPFTWDNERRATVEAVPPFAIERHNVTNAAFSRFVDAGGYDDPRWWTAADWAWRREAAVDHPPFWTREGERWWWRGMFDRLALPPSWPVYVSQAEAAAYARWNDARLPTECEYLRAAYGSPSGGRASLPMGRGGARVGARRPRHGVVGSPSGGQSSRGRQRLGDRRSRRQRLGMDVDGVRSAAGLHAPAVVSRVLRRLLRRRTRRDEGRLAGHGRRAGAAVLPQLVPAALSIRLRDVPVRPRRRPAMTPPAHSAVLPPVVEAHHAFAADVRRYLTERPRQLPSRYLYDALGSALFDAICELPWYPVTRTETALLATHGRAILASGAAAPARIVELGAGNGTKLATLLAATGTAPPSVHLVDVSAAALETAARTLATVVPDPVETHQATFERGLADLAGSRPDGRTLVVFLGSNIGNFDGAGARTFLRQMRAAMASGDGLLIGIDLVKPEADMLLAYDDPLGVTAAFNLNLLVHLNRELDADFDLTAFRHRAVWNARASRIEMHLVSRRAQRVRIRAADLELNLEDGEAIWTESSYKYTLPSVESLLADAGFRVRDQWVDDAHPFALTLAAR